MPYANEAVGKNNAASNNAIVYMLLCSSRKCESLLVWQRQAIERIQLESVRNVPIILIHTVLQ